MVVNSSEKWLLDMCIFCLASFALRDVKGNEIGVFAGKQPRQSDLKAANIGIKDIRLR
jgi:hypothetical protein